MSYSCFNLKTVEKAFQLQETVQNLFPSVPNLEISDWLQQTLEKGACLPLKSEKARSEMIIAPILLEMMENNQRAFTIFSGETLDVDANKGLNGECDFIISKAMKTYTIQAPILIIKEAKQNIVENNMGQCAAQMLGARIFNQSENQAIETIFGCVTNGEVWQFLKLEDQTILIDAKKYFIDNLEQILGVLQAIIDFYSNH
ncbi:MAG: hypothetical protein DRR16_24505 [Candidatus Parabeggiatoa sp. nov. 3]|mgnify:CR=1 FL=1|nr:MAG: hypothetical protein DRR00_10305 [Gammaproteobacteria bacterium]RKZ66776.1 MAG: hypothetical protein DRQ99_08630 [Gammaproteobacteria bacterium]RKZ80088.1 MAG: hypothetical protein DRR16_24505 [Gammaproteobacteria bacterium]HEW97631.1 hypothetical protein [Beggiatoa sp.]